MPPDGAVVEAVDLGQPEMAVRGTLALLEIQELPVIRLEMAVRVTLAE